MQEKVIRLDSAQVEVRDHHPRTQLDIASLAESIENSGQINPIIVKKRGNKYQVIAGRRRLTAIQYLAKSQKKKYQVLVIVKEISELQEELILIDENLMRQDLTESEMDEAIYRRKQIYEELHPTTKRGVAGGTSKATGKHTEPFTKNAAKKLNVTSRTVEKAVARASKATDQVKKARTDGKLSPSKVDLLVTLSPQDQDLLLPLAKKRDVAELKDLVAQSKKRGAKAVVLDDDEITQEDQRLKPLVRDAKRLGELLQEALEARLTLEGDTKHDSLRVLDQLEECIGKFTSFQRAALGYVKAISRRDGEKRIIKQSHSSLIKQAHK